MPWKLSWHGPGDRLGCRWLNLGLFLQGTWPTFCTLSSAPWFIIFNHFWSRNNFWYRKICCNVGANKIWTLVEKYLSKFMNLYFFYDLWTWDCSRNSEIFVHCGLVQSEGIALKIYFFKSLEVLLKWQPHWLPDHKFRVMIQKADSCHYCCCRSPRFPRTIELGIRKISVMSLPNFLSEA